MKKDSIISGQNVCIGYNNVDYLYSDLNFDLREGELTCLLGANGSGKSTLLRTISANQHILGGSIHIDGKDVITVAKKKELSRLMGLVLTDQTNVGGLLVRELVELGRYPYTGFFGQLSKEDEIIVEKSMADVNILHKANAYMSELSDGEKQKAMIAKVIAQECPVLLLDEPTAFLDLEGRIDIMSLLHDLATIQGKTILLSTHDVDLALRLADRLWLLSREKGLYSGVTEDVIISGKMDNFFKSENVEFKRESGNFYSRLKADKKVFVEVPDEIYHWIKNILERKAFSITTRKEDSLFTLLASSADNIQICCKEKEYIFKNFESLSEWLSNY